MLAEENLFLMFPERDRSQARAHAPAHNHIAQNLSDTFQIIGGAGRDLVECDFFRHTAAHQDADFGQELRFGNVRAFFLRQRHGIAARLAARYDCHFMNFIRFRHQFGDNRVPRFVVGGDFAFAFAHDVAATFRTVGDFFTRFFEFRHADRLLVLPRRQQRRFVQKVGQIRAGKARRFLGDNLKVNIAFQRFIFRVDFQDRFPAAQIRTADYDLTVKTPRTQERRIQNIRAVRRRERNNAFVRAEAIHLDQELVQRLFTFIMTAAEAGAALATDRIDFINKDDAGRVLLRLDKQIADAGRADTDKHFDEVRAADTEKRHIRFAGNGFRQERFTGTGRTEEQDAFRNPRADGVIFTRMFQEINDFRQFLFGFFFAGDIGKGNMHFAFFMHFRARFTEVHHATAAALRLIHDKEPDADQKQNRQQRSQHTQPPGRLFRRLGLNSHVIGA